MSGNLGSVRGTLSEYVEGVNVLEGFRYSGSPAGSLRWTHSPEPSILNYTVNATGFAPECPQLVNSVIEGDEDCLFLNVWTPEGFTNTSNYPVFFWAYGGRFSDVSASLSTYDGSALAKRGIIVITMNYLLGPLGWLAHPDLSAENVVNQGYNASGNWGLMGQQAALHWTVENIGNVDTTTRSRSPANQPVPHWPWLPPSLPRSLGFSSASSQKAALDHPATRSPALWRRAILSRPRLRLTVSNTWPPSMSPPSPRLATCLWPLSSQQTISSTRPLMERP